MNETRNPEPIICKLCGSADVVKFGTYKGVQRYWCNTCKHKPSVKVVVGHVKRGTMRMPETRVGRPRRIRRKTRLAKMRQQVKPSISGLR